mmetsp:Transcript_60089/g.95411  ORF Transcript_60089/g.95411 Transcript_60089/m.95411 type:complete len:108 (+) Transcript_60089:483-806(+)
MSWWTLSFGAIQRNWHSKMRWNKATQHNRGLLPWQMMTGTLEVSNGQVEPKAAVGTLLLAAMIGVPLQQLAILKAGDVRDSLGSNSMLGQEISVRMLDSHGVSCECQ